MAGRKAVGVVALTVIVLVPGFAHRGVGALRKPYGGSLKLPQIGVVRTTDPARITTPAELRLARQLHDTLYRYGSDGCLRPVLAHDLPEVTSGGQELIIHLRADARFHDGTPVTTGEVIRSWERLVHAGTRSAHWWLLAPVEGALAFRRGASTKIAGLEAINRLSLRIRLQAPAERFVEVLAAVPTAPLPARVLSAAKVEIPHPPGCGPFTWAAGTASSEVQVMEAFLDHVHGRPFVDRLLIKTYGSPRATRLAFELEEIHVCRDRLSRIAENRTIVDGPQVWLNYLILNPARMDDLPQGFERAVEQAIDRPALVEYVVGEQGQATDELLRVDTPTRDVAKLRGDPAAARAYFKRVVQHGHGVPPVLIFLVRRGEALERAVAERIQVNLVDIGVVVSVVEQELDAFEKRVAKGDYDFYLASPLPLVQSPELQLLGVAAGLHSEQGVEEVLQVMRELPAGANRPAMVRERARLFRLRFPWIPLFQTGQRVVRHDMVKDYLPLADGLVDMAEVWLAH